MFQGSTANLFDYAVRLIEQVGEVVSTLPNRVSIHGHTDGIDFQRADGYSNWELSSDRANAARRILAQTGVSNDRFSEVVGKAATEPMFPDNPNRSENRRITILIIREAPVVPPKLGGGN